ncbi:hypothetical protein AXI58_19525 [Bacillus nakamurai]|uniref:Uncharacterized protein n=1 Tax=Bacillus nakamurai TaxID=1793963 RepID=A0A150F486_9BACI|nr:hypothetical protein AXI58_19525 [Bacillus nakamurai]
MISGVIIEKSRLWLACFFAFQLYISESDTDFPYFKANAFHKNREVHNLCDMSTTSISSFRLIHTPDFPVVFESSHSARPYRIRDNVQPAHLDEERRMPIHLITVFVRLAATALTFRFI